MKLTLAYVAALSLAMCTIAEAKGSGRSGGFHSVRGYTTSKGTYVAPHFATNRNGTKLDNWSTKGNVNPFTGAVGTKNP
jgi:hypothetical protein